ncbi:uncharacterized protein LOC131642546 [Vicia villosa]|uniref:uncharacterized protein LOC131642546 n=1 Tax=Vicia villosa TaxID=3911 RepID=UPI00273C52F2|nr:uncharacterized protein LOC131642546 [Vicia villosa]
MGKKLDALLGRNNFRIDKFKPTVNLAISRLAVLKNQRNVRLRQNRSDVLQLLQLPDHHKRALLRVEHVIKEQNMLDVYDEIEGYLNLLIERIHLIAQERECPDELQEAASGILFAASRCGDFPEIQEIRAILTSRFGKEFASRAIELRNNCKVSLKIVTKLSTRMPSLESRMKVLKEIASENNITLQFEEVSSTKVEEQVTIEEKKNQHKFEKKEEDNEQKSDSFKGRKKYKDVADAAQAAFESAAYAADAARAAVELSRFQSYDPRDDDDDHDDNSSSPQSRKVLNEHDHSVKAMSPLEGEESNKNIEELEKAKDVFSSNSDGDAVDEEIESGSGLVLESKMGSTPFIDLEKKPFSVRTRKVQGY